MSFWTYVDGTILVDTFAITNEEAIYITKTVVNHLPLITGSEESVQYYINLLNGHNISSNCDEFEEKSNLCKIHREDLFETQSKVLISLHGDLRDRTLPRVTRETAKMLSRLSSRLEVSSCIISLRCMAESRIIHNPEWVLHRDHTNWTDKIRRSREY